MISEDFVRDLYRDLLGYELDAERIRDLARRYNDLHRRITELRQTHQGLLAPYGPAVTLDLSHPGWAEPIRDPLPLEKFGSYRPSTFLAVQGHGGKPDANRRDQHGPSAGDHSGRHIAPELRMTITEAARRLRRRELSPRELLEQSLARIDEVEPAIRAFYTLLPDQARVRAAELDKRLKDTAEAGDVEASMPLAGIPIGIKDIIDTAGVRTTYGSKIFRDHVPPSAALVTEKLLAAGAILVGKLATHEFARGTTNLNPHFGPTRNPWDVERVPGGSSGGAGAAVAAGCVFLGLGTDTGGSVRIPAACCGTVGLKPTYGLISNEGVWVGAWSLDQVGPLTRSVADAALVLTVLAGQEPGDLTTLKASSSDYMAAVQAGEAGHVRGMRVGVDETWLTHMVEPSVSSGIRRVLVQLEEAGVDVVPVTLPPLGAMTLVARVINLAEGASYHAALLSERADDYGNDVRTRLELGQMILATDYVWAQRLRQVLTRTVLGIMKNLHALVVPTIPVVAPRADQHHIDWGDAIEAVPEALPRLTSPFNLTGQPALSLPIGLDPQGVPLAMQIVGKPFDESTVLRLGAACEHLVRWNAWPPV